MVAKSRKIHSHRGLLHLEAATGYTIAKSYRAGSLNHLGFGSSPIESGRAAWMKHRPGYALESDGGSHPHGDLKRKDTVPSEASFLGSENGVPLWLRHAQRSIA